MPTPQKTSAITRPYIAQGQGHSNRHRVFLEDWTLGVRIKIKTKCRHKETEFLCYLKFGNYSNQENENLNE